MSHIRRFHIRLLWSKIQTFSYKDTFEARFLQKASKNGVKRQFFRVELTPPCGAAKSSAELASLGIKKPPYQVMFSEPHGGMCPRALDAQSVFGFCDFVV